MLFKKDNFPNFGCLEFLIEETSKIIGVHIDSMKKIKFKSVFKKTTATISATAAE